MSESKVKYTRLAKAARVLNEKVNLLQAELAGLLQVMWVLAEQNGGSIVLSDKELASVPPEATLQTFRDEAKEEYVFVAQKPEPPVVTDGPVPAPVLEGEDA